MDKIMIDQYKAFYALINDDGIVRCAWCRKPKDEIKDLDKHLTKHEEEDKKNE